jgi:hypothetical protein
MDTATYNNRAYTLDELAPYMDDDLREQIHAELAPCTGQEFVDAYAKAHEAKFGEVWCVD